MDRGVVCLWDNLVELVGFGSLRRGGGGGGVVFLDGLFQRRHTTAHP